jgi:uncharacterized protein (UPF0216 family)
MKKPNLKFPRLRNERGRFIEKTKARVFFELAGIEKKLKTNQWGKLIFTNQDLKEIQQDAQKKYTEQKDNFSKIENSVFVDYLSITGTIKKIEETKGQISIETPKKIYETERLESIYLVQRYETIIRQNFPEVAQVIFIVEERGKDLKIICK